MHLHNCRYFQEHLRMLLQSLRAHCLAPGRSQSTCECLEALVRLPGVSGRIASGFQTELHFADEAVGIQVVGWKLAAMLLEDTEQTVKLCRWWVMGRTYLRVQSTGNEVESEAKWFQEVLCMVVNATADSIIICAQSTRQWNCEIKERWSQLGREKRKRCRSAAKAQPKAALQKSIWRAKDRMWNEYLKNLRGADVWRAEMYAIPWEGATMQAQTARDGKQADTFTGKEQMLRQRSSPPNEHKQYFDRPPGVHMHQFISEQTLKQALIARLVWNAPGLDTLPFGAVPLVS